MRLIFAILTLIPVLASAQNRVLIRELFDRDDVNRDGKVSFAEFADVYKRIDTIGNGKITEQELKTALGQINPSDEKFARKFFRAYDVNKDCSISSVEWQFLFREIDTDHDGEFTEPDLQYFFFYGFPRLY